MEKDEVKGNVRFMTQENEIKEEEMKDGETKKEGTKKEEETSLYNKEPNEVEFLETQNTLELENKIPPTEETLQQFMENMTSLNHKLENIEATTSKSDKTMQELHKLYHTEFAGRLKKMQEELDNYHEVDKGRIHDDVLIDIAKLYSANEDLVGLLGNERIKYLFMDLLQILESNGVTKLKSKTGVRRNTRHCQVIEQTPTDNQELHDTVVESMNTGFYIENRTFIKEIVHVYVFKG